MFNNGKTRKQKAQTVVKAINALAALMPILDREPESTFTDKQSESIDRVLRHLDLTREYKIGDQLRTAFGIELDAVKEPGRKNKY